MQPPNRLPATHHHHHRRKEQGSDPTGRAVGKGRLPTVLGLGAALMIFALALFAAATPAFAQEESTMLGATAMQLTGGSPELSSQTSTMAPPATTQMTTTMEPPVRSTQPTTPYPSTLPSTTATTSQPSATVPSNATMSAVQSQYSDRTQAGTLANTGGISPIALVLGILVVLLALAVLVHRHERHSEEAADE